MPVSTFRQIDRRKAVSGQIWRERSSKQRRGSSSHRNGFTFGPTQHRVAATIDQHISNSDPISFWRERQRDSFKGIMIDHEQLNPLVRWRSLTLFSPHRGWKAKVFLYKGWILRFFKIFFYLHRDMQVLPNSEASIVLSKSLAGAREDWRVSWKKSQSIARGKERLLVIGLAKRPYI